ncbi:hypothetical protein MaudMau93_007948 [Microsporum audouinii]
MAGLCFGPLSRALAYAIRRKADNAYRGRRRRRNIANSIPAAATADEHQPPPPPNCKPAIPPSPPKKKPASPLPTSEEEQVPSGNPREQEISQVQEEVIEGQGKIEGVPVKRD